MEVTREKHLKFAFAKFDGIVGLGFQEIAAGDVIPIWYCFYYDKEYMYFDLYACSVVLETLNCDESAGTIWWNKLS